MGLGQSSSHVCSSLENHALYYLQPNSAIHHRDKIIRSAEQLDQIRFYARNLLEPLTNKKRKARWEQV